VVAHDALGSNQDDPITQVRAAVRALDAIPACRVQACSSLYRTPPWGYVDQPDFVNAVARVETRLGPFEVLDALLAIEQAAGRERAFRWGPRVLDLDLLLHGDARMEDARLVLPHPRMHERAFVILPLAEIDPDLVLPGVGRVAGLAATLSSDGIERLAASALQA
jgi:2-amino-4-hydroxy-6-hydroxymethyldihydropteridine diphosphokinase